MRIESARLSCEGDVEVEAPHLVFATISDRPINLQLPNTRRT